MCANYLCAIPCLFEREVGIKASKGVLNYLRFEIRRFHDTTNVHRRKKESIRSEEYHRGGTVLNRINIQI